jgi:hypothetical protein
MNHGQLSIQLAQESVMPRIRFRTAALVTALSSAFAGLTGCANTSGQVVSNAEQQLQSTLRSTPINGYCPVHPDRKVDAKVMTARFKGRIVGFSSIQALRVWNTWPAARKSRFVNRQLALANGNRPAIVAAETH